MQFSYNLHLSGGTKYSNTLIIYMYRYVNNFIIEKSIESDSKRGFENEKIKIFKTWHVYFKTLCFQFF